jgi:hypothetical protein
VLGAALLRRKVGGKKSNFGCFVCLGRACALDDGEAAAPGQVGFKRLEGIDLYGSLVEATVFSVGLLCVGKKGVACSAVRLAALKAWRFSFLSWRK